MISPQQQSQIDEIFLAVMQHAPDKRVAFLAQKREGLDPVICLEVEQLLEGDRAANNANLTEVSWNLSGYLNLNDDPLDDIAEDGEIGDYCLLKKIGEGGMGVVYLADQLRPVRRQVALKVIKPGMDSKRVVARFEAERQTLALMNHPNIAKVFDASTTESGRLYFAMELVQGSPITTYCDESQLSLRERLELFISVCCAVQHAHQKGIIHRDLKPSNVLVTSYASQAVPKVIDFGIAKATAHSLTDNSQFTQLGQYVGTLEYMSPEQAQFDQLDIDTRSDVYSLGVLLYELLTGTTPLDRASFRSSGFEEILRSIREVDVMRPSIRLSATITASKIAGKCCTAAKMMMKSLRGELDWIVMRALEKDRTRRYETADAFAADVRRYLDDEPVVACPPTASYRIRKTLMRNRKTVVAVGVVFLALLVGVFGTSLQWLRSTRLAQELKESVYVSDMKLANQAHNTGDMDRVAEILRRHRPEVSGQDQRGFEWYYLSRLTSEVERVPFLAGRGAVDRVTFLRQDGVARLAVFQNQHLTVRQFPFANLDPPVYRTTAKYSNEWYWLPCVAMAPVGDLVATIENLVADQLSQFRLVFREGSTGRILDSIDIAAALNAKPTDDLRGTAIAFSADGKRLVTGHWNGTVAGWSLNARDQIEKAFARRSHAAAVVAVAMDARGEVVATASWDRQVQLTKFSDVVEPKLFSHESPLNDLALSADGRKLFSITQRGRLYITDAETREQHVTDEGVILFAVAIAPNEQLVAVGGEDGMIRIHDATSGRLISKLRGHAGGIRELAFSLDGRWLISGGERGQVRQWRMTDELAFRSDAFAPRLDSSPAERILDVSTAETVDLAFHPTGPLLAISAGKHVKFFDLAQNRLDHSIEMDGKIRSIDFSPEGERIFVGTLATAPQPGTRVFDVATCDLTTKGRESFDANVAMLGRDGRYVVLSRDHPGAKTADISVFDTEANKVCLELASNDHCQYGYGVDRSALSPDNTILAVFAREGGMDSDASTIQAWDLGTKQQLWTNHAHDEPIHCLEFSPDGKLLASTSDDHTIRFWEPTSGKLLGTLKGHRSWVMEAVFSPDGKMLASVSVDGTVRLWDVTSGNERFVFRGDGSPFISIGMSRDGNVIAAGNLHGKVFVWHANANTIDSSTF